MFISFQSQISLQAISPFPTAFSKDLYYRHVKTRTGLGMSYKPFTRHKIESICRQHGSNGENDLVEKFGYQHFLLFLQCFQAIFMSGSLKLAMRDKK